MKTRRSGIANLVGLVFFVLVVGLVVSTLILLFSGTSGYVAGIHTSNSEAVGTTNTVVNIQNMTFGGIYARAQSSIALSSSNPHAILPIPNMNLTGNDEGWYVSTAFPALHDNATLKMTETNTSSIFLPNEFPFALTVWNNDPPGSGTSVAKVTLLLDSNLTHIIVGTPPSGWNFQASQGGKNITWYTPAVNGLTPQESQTFPWSANAPATVGTLYQTVAVYWFSESPAYKYIDMGIATLSASTTTVGTKFSVEKATSSGSIVGTSPHDSLRPGGLTAGYDGNALSTTSSSGPGSLYADFQPSINSGAVPAGDQLTGTVNFTAPFSLQTNLPTSLGCCSVTWESDMGAVLAAPNPLIFYHVYLSNSTWSIVVNVNGTNPTLANYFKSSGWQSYAVSLTPGMLHNANTLEAGSYSLTVSVSMTMPSGSPSGVMMHFDDIGLAIKLPSASPNNAYGTQELQLNLGAYRSQVQAFSVGLNITGGVPASNPVEYAYMFAADSASGTLKWAELGSATLTSSATMEAALALPNADYYVNSSGYLDVLIRVVAPASNCAPLSTCQSLSVSAYAVVATTIQSRGVVTLEGEQGSLPVHLTSLYITGPNGITDVPLANYVTSGDLLIIAVNNFPWLTGQTYTVTVATAGGLSFSRSFTAPTA